MASTFVRSVNCRSLSSLHSCVKPRAAPAPPRRASVPAGSTSQATHFSRSSNPSVPARRFLASSRCSSELGCCWGSLFPLHSAAAAARLNWCLSSASGSCRDLSQVHILQFLDALRNIHLVSPLPYTQVRVSYFPLVEIIMKH